MTEFALASIKISKHFNRIMTKTFMNFMELNNEFNFYKGIVNSCVDCITCKTLSTVMTKF